LRFIETYQLVDCHGCSQSADSRNGMEDAVMRAIKELANADAGK
jgi:hypothetical protein